MRQNIKMVGILGMLWTTFVIILGFSLPGTPPEMRFLSLTATQFFLFWRLFELRRWAAIAACVYCGWMVLTSFGAGIWQWTVTWIFLTWLVTKLLTKAWCELRAGI